MTEKSNELERKMTGPDGPLFSIRGFHVEPKIHEPDPVVANEYDTAQSAYLAASGTLTQFNALVVAVQAAAFSATAGGLRTMVAIALLLHLVSAFLLCWAARPGKPSKAADIKIGLLQARLHVVDTYKNYRRGWRSTMIALCASTAALLAYGLIALGVSIPGFFIRGPVYTISSVFH